MNWNPAEWFRNSVTVLGASATASAGLLAAQSGDGSIWPVILGGTATTISGLLSSKLGNAFDEHQKAARSGRELFLNHDLHNLTGEAIRHVIEQSPLNADGILTTLSEAFSKEWTPLLTTPGFAEYVARLSKSELPQWFHAAADVDPNRNTAHALVVDNWRVMLTAVGRKHDCEPSKQVIEDLAKDLITSVPFYTRELLKEDFRGDSPARGRAYAGYTIRMLSEILAGIATMNSERGTWLQSLTESRTELASIGRTVTEEISRLKRLTDLPLPQRVSQQLGQWEGIQSVLEQFSDDWFVAELQNLDSHSDTFTLVELLAERNEELHRTTHSKLDEITERLFAKPGLSVRSDAVPAPWENDPFPSSKLPRTGDQLIGRSKEKATLTRAWNSPKTSIVQIVAPGGVGKTQLVKKWQESLLDRHDHGGAVRAFDWSFYSQGTQQQASADDFFDKALRWFGEPDPQKLKDPWARGERLAELVRQHPTLMILDGMEPLQHPPGPMAGELTDPSIKALLQGLRRENPGLCIVTTREAVPTLAEMSEPKRVTVDLDRLSPQAGAELLRQYGVRDVGWVPDPTKPPPGKVGLGSQPADTVADEYEELRQASIDVDGHALALILMGTYLKARCGGDVRRRSEALLFHGHERYAAHAHKVMAQYEVWFEQQDETGRAAVAILRLMGLFNRPADAGCLAALRAEPPIPGLTEALFVGDRDELWQRAIERLRAARLLTEDEMERGRHGEQEQQHIPISLSPCLSIPRCPSIDSRTLLGPAGRSVS